MTEIYGTSGPDRIVGTAASEDIYGRAGDDTISGGGGGDDIEAGAGDDVVSGDAGDDELYGEAGDDTLDGGAGDDELEGGSGRDVFLYGEGRDEIDDFRAGEDLIRLDPALGVNDLADVLSRAEPRDGGDDTLIRFSDGDTLLLEDVRLETLSADFFAFAPGSEPTPQPDPTPPALDDTARLVTVYYQVYFDRSPDEAGRDFWVGVMESGSGFTDRDLASAFFSSSEFETRVAAPDPRTTIERIYEQALGREADAGGLAFWLDIYERDVLTVEEIAYAFASSEETQRRFAPDPSPSTASGTGSDLDIAAPAVPSEDEDAWEDDRWYDDAWDDDWSHDDAWGDEALWS